jgi:hypothetical protein
MKLVISITGLCVLLPAKDGRSVQVVMPKTGFTSGGTTVETHDPVLFYLGIRPDRVDMRGYAIDLRGLSASGKAPDLSLLLDIPEVAGGIMNPDAVVCKITLPLPDDQTHSQPYEWGLTNQQGNHFKKHLTHQLTWTIDSADLGEVTWKRRALGSGTLQSVQRPVPASDGTITLFISHLPRTKHPVCRDKPATHALAYYKLFGITAELPRLKQNSPDCNCPENNCSEKERKQLRDRAEAAFNCMLAKGPPT